jgi:hypothetical protein
MKLPTWATRSGDTALLWLACAFALCAGCYAAFGLIGTLIDRQRELSGQVADRLLADARILAHRPALETQVRAAEDRINALDLSADAPVTVARFIHAAAQIALEHHVELKQVDGAALSSAVVAPPAAAQPAENEPFESIPLDVALSGSYTDLLAAIRELAGAPLTMRIEIAAIERNPTDPAASSSGPLVARLHIVLQRLPERAAVLAAAADPNHPVSEDASIHARSF